MIKDKLGFGLMRLPLIGADSKDIDIEQFKKMVDLYLERGFTYFDTSYVYHNGESENAVRKALTSRHARSEYRLASKFPAFLNIGESDKIEAVFQEQLDKCGVSYFDYYLLHNLNRSLVKFVEESGLFEHAQEWKKQGKILHLGFSWHDSAEELGRVLDRHPEIEFVQIVVNYYDWDEPVIQSRKCYETIRAHGCGVIAMEPVKGGTLAAVPESAKQRMEQLHPELTPSAWALRFAANLDGMIAVLSGMSNLEQVDDNTTSMKEFDELTGDELTVYGEAKAAIAEQWKIKCDWAKLDAAAPHGVPVSNVIRMYNSCLLQPNPYFAAELNYYKLFKEHYNCPDMESWDYSSCTKALDGLVDADGAVKEAAGFLSEHSF